MVQAISKHELEGLLIYCDSEVQRKAVQAYIKHGTAKKAAEALNKSERNLRKNIRLARINAAKSGWSPNDDVKVSEEPGFHLKGKSVFMDATTGEASRVWYKWDADKEEQEEKMRAVVDELTAEVKPRKAIKLKSKSRNENLLNLFTLTDYHVGMLSWPKETGDKWDIPLAIDTAHKAFKYLISASPDADTAVFCENGDFAHFDSLEAVTPTNKHILDADGRAHKMIRACINIMIDAIEQLAEKYKKVIVVVSEGNHNPVGSVWMAELLSKYYEKNPRIEIIVDPKPYIALEWGVNMLGFYHGHLARKDKVPDIFMGDYREMYGRTKLLHVHTGHTHHRELKETNTCILETHPTLAGRDAYAARGGWQSDRCMQVITYHKEYKEVSRNLVHIDMIE